MRRRRLRSGHGQRSVRGRAEAPEESENKGEPTEADLAALDSTNWDEIKAEVDALRQRIGAMGAVNLVAIEEYSELKQRYEFLKTQNDDLASAKAQLLKAIDDINQTSLEQFQVTFDQIRKNFAYTFNILFGGGRAEIELVTADDPLESGIEIVAQPPGTKLKGITLLSGGQKTLTAVALLFALYMVKPSPFCLLDELDAPLDESNIHRFTNLLKQFVKESQFIIITHNKSTVSAARAIYGVTMEERGVSKTVSMRFNHDQGRARGARRRRSRTRCGRRRVRRWRKGRACWLRPAASADERSAVARWAMADAFRLPKTMHRCDLLAAQYLSPVLAARNRGKQKTRPLRIAPSLLARSRVRRERVSERRGPSWSWVRRRRLPPRSCRRAHSRGRPPSW